MRSLVLWLLAMPLTLVGSVPAAAIVLWVATTSYIYLGIDELGAQVEQPFQIMPLWQLCQMAQANIEESLSSPDFQLRMQRVKKTTPSSLDGVWT